MNFAARNEGVSAKIADPAFKYEDPAALHGRVGSWR
jgi:hypothetical protein